MEKMNKTFLVTILFSVFILVSCMKNSSTPTSSSNLDSSSSTYSASTWNLDSSKSYGVVPVSSNTNYYHSNYINFDFNGKIVLNNTDSILAFPFKNSIGFKLDSTSVGGYSKMYLLFTNNNIQSSILSFDGSVLFQIDSTSFWNSNHLVIINHGIDVGQNWYFSRVPSSR